MSNYLTLEEFKANSGLSEVPVDAFAQVAIDAAEEAIESYCGRVFTQSGTVTRYYTPDDQLEVPVDDLVTAATVLTDDDGDGTYETTWASTEYLLAPYNAATDGKPYTRLEANAAVTRTFPLVAKGLQITGTWGWPAVPDRVKQATLLQATRLFKRTRSSPFGVEAVTIDGSPVRLRAELDPDVRMMLAGLRRWGVA